MQHEQQGIDEIEELLRLFQQVDEKAQSLSTLIHSRFAETAGSRVKYFVENIRESLMELCKQHKHGELVSQIKADLAGANARDIGIL